MNIDVAISMSQQITEELKKKGAKDDYTEKKERQKREGTNERKNKESNERFIYTRVLLPIFKLYYY